MKADQERVSNLLSDTVTLLCRNGLQYKTEMKVQGLLGITLDDEVFLVHIDKKFGEMIGAELVALHASQDAEDSYHSENSASDAPVSPSGRKRNRIKRKRRKSNGSVDSQAESPSEKKSHVVIKPEPFQEEDDEDLVMIDSKIGLHDKDTMRESYGVSYDNDSNLLQHVQNDGQSENSYSGDGSMVKHNSKAGCSTWDDPLAALTEQNNSVATHGGSSSGGDDAMDQQTMSTGMFQRFQHGSTSGYMLNPNFRRGKNPYNFVCPEKFCGKRFNYKHNLLRHQTTKHGRVPKQSFQAWLPDFQMSMEQGVNPNDFPQIPQGSLMKNFPGENEMGPSLFPDASLDDMVQDSADEPITAETGNTTDLPLEENSQAEVPPGEPKEDSNEKVDESPQDVPDEMDPTNRAEEVAADPDDVSQPGADMPADNSASPQSNTVDESDTKGVVVPEAGEESASNSQDWGGNIFAEIKQEPVSMDDPVDNMPMSGSDGGMQFQQSSFSQKGFLMKSGISKTGRPGFDQQGDMFDIPPLPYAAGTKGAEVWEAFAKTTSDYLPPGSFNQSAMGGALGMPTPYRQGASTENIYKCEICGKSYNLKHNLQRHQTTKHGRNPRASTSLFSPFM